MGKGGWTAVGVAVVVALGGQALLDGKNETPARPVNQASPSIDTPLSWRDHALGFQGQVRWDGRSGTATVGADVFDGATGRKLTSGSYSARVLQDAPGRVVLQTSVEVPGDSVNNQRHSHPVNLVFQSNGAGWAFARNCEGPSPPALCF
jgi:hypothetical protein